MAQIERILPVLIGGKRKLYLIEGVLTERWLHKMQDPNRFEVSEGALEPKSHQSSMENSPNHQIRSGDNKSFKGVLRGNIQCHIQQISSECELVLFRNDSPGAKVYKSTQQKSLEEHVRGVERVWEMIQGSEKYSAG